MSSKQSKLSNKPATKEFAEVGFAVMRAVVNNELDPSLAQDLLERKLNYPILLKSPAPRPALN